MSANEPMSDERLARLAADNEPVGDHLSGLTADEVAELVAEVRRQRFEIARGNQEIETLGSEVEAEHREAEEARTELTEVRKAHQLSEAQLIEVTLERAEWRKQSQHHETVAKILRSGLEVEYTVGNGIEPYRPATFTNVEAARQSRDLHRDEDGQIMRRLIGDWEVLPGDE